LEERGLSGDIATGCEFVESDIRRSAIKSCMYDARIAVGGREQSGGRARASW
jgi:hypothetical protein